MVQVMVRPVSTMLRTTRITTAAALASSPAPCTGIAIRRAASAEMLRGKLHQKMTACKDSSQSQCVRGQMVVCVGSQLG